jgi:hypothetical protein
MHSVLVDTAAQENIPHTLYIDNFGFNLFCRGVGPMGQALASEIVSKKIEVTVHELRAVGNFLSSLFISIGLRKGHGLFHHVRSSVVCNRCRPRHDKVHVQASQQKLEDRGCTHEKILLDSNYLPQSNGTAAVG